MKIKSIKKYALTALIVIAIVAVFAFLFWGISKFVSSKDKGQVIAKYDDVVVYEADVQDIINYHLVKNVNSQTQPEDYPEIIKDAVITYVRMKVTELDLAERGYKIDEKELKQEYKAAVDEIEKTISFSEWCKSYNVSSGFLKEEVRRYLVADLYKIAAAKELDLTVSEDDMLKYYQAHAMSDYLKQSGYYWTSVLRPVKDATDEKELAEAKAEAEAYLEKVKNGTMTLEQVNEELDKKYNDKNGYSSYVYDGSDVTSISSVPQFIDEPDFKNLLKAIDEEYSKRDPSGDETSEGYKEYMSYLGRMFEAHVYYAIQNLEPGEVWTEPLLSFSGYYLIRFDHAETKDEFVPFEEVKDEIRELVKDEMLEEKYETYLSALEQKYSVEYYFA